MGIVRLLVLTSVVFVSLKGGRVLMTLYALDLGAGPFETGLLFAVYGLVPALFAVRAGRIVDRIGNHAMMYCGLLGMVVSLCLPITYPRLAMLFLSAPLMGITSMLFIVATQNLVGVLATPATRTRNFSWYSIGESTANVAGPVLVGLMIDHAGYPVAYAVLAVIVAACIVALHAGRRDIPRGGAPDAAREQRSAADLLRLPELRMALLSNGIVMTGIDLFNVYLPVYARDIGFSATTIGLIVGAFGAAGFIVRFAIPPVTARLGERGMLAGALAVACVAFIGIPLTANAWIIGAASFALGLGLGCGQPLSMILAFNAAPKGRSAEAIAMRLVVSYGAHVVIPPIFGALGAVVGLAPIFWTCSVILAGGSALNRRWR